MSERPRVLWLIRGLGPGGAERLLVAHARAASGAIDYEVAYQVAAKDQLVPELRDAGVTVHLLGSGPGWPVELRRLVAERDIDLVHAHAPAMAAGARLALRALPGGPRPKLVYTEHNRWEAYRPPTRWSNALTFGLDHRSYAVSEEARRSVAAMLRRRVVTVHHGIDGDEVRAVAGDRSETRRSLGIPEDVVVAANVANFRREKAHEVLVEATKILRARDVALHLLLVGQGQRFDEIAELIHQRGVGDQVSMLGFRGDVHAVLAASDVMVLSSDHEGLPVAVMEAFALGVPIVSTSVGGIPEACDHEVEGLLVAPRDPEALSAALERMANDPSLRRRLADGARRRADRFDARAVTARLEGDYASLLAR